MPHRPEPALFLANTPPAARLLWLPALGVPAAKYSAFASALASRGLTVLVHEWRGTGACGWRPRRGSDWGYREWLYDDLPLAFSALQAACPDRPTLLAGHSIGGQMALLAAALGLPADGAVAVASGIPHWRLFPARRDRLTIRGFAASIDPLTRLLGHFPGHRLGFAGREAGQVMRDWAQTVRRGHYAELRGLPDDLMARLASLRLPLLGLRFADDAWVPPASMKALFEVTGSASTCQRVLDASTLGRRADHFAWMRRPEAVAEAIAQWWRESSGLSS